MDEPTSVLTPQEVNILFGTLRQLAAEGTSILYISHKLEEIKALCDEATILRRGKVVGTCTPREKSAREMAEMMVGATLNPPERAAAELGPVALKVQRLSVASPSAFGTSLKDDRASRCGRARFWASAGSPGTGRMSCCWRCRASCGRRRDTVQIHGRGIGDHRAE